MCYYRHPTDDWWYECEIKEAGTASYAPWKVTPLEGDQKGEEVECYPQDIQLGSRGPRPAIKTKKGHQIIWN